MNRVPATLRPLAVALLWLPFVGCDTDNSGNALDDVDGTYVFTELRFDPSASALADADVLARLDASASELDIFTDGDAQIVYRIADEDGNLGTYRANATASATRSTVRLQAATEDDAEKLGRLLLPATLSLRRSDTSEALSAESTTQVNLSAFDPDTYSGLNNVAGTLHVRLEPAD